MGAARFHTTDGGPGLTLPYPPKIGARVTLESCAVRRPGLKIVSRVQTSRLGVLGVLVDPSGPLQPTGAGCQLHECLHGQGNARFLRSTVRLMAAYDHT